MKILVTGASGFVGRALVERLARDGEHTVVATVRRPPSRSVPAVEYAIVGDLNPSTEWGAVVRGCDVVVHAAARVHLMKDPATDPLAEFRRVNVQGTLNLARQAMACGVRRFVFVSSIRVNGGETVPDRPFEPDDEPAPVDAYGRSKLEAELGLRKLLGDAGVGWVIVRPPLVYGPHVQANFLRMMRWLQRGLPLPFAGVQNQRSLIALDNLVSLLHRCSVHPSAADEVFLAADGEDLSTAELLRRMGAALGTRARLIQVPPAMLFAAAGLIGKGDFARRLLCSLQVDAAKARAMLGWVPEVTVDEGLTRRPRLS